MESARDFDKTF